MDATVILSKNVKAQHLMNGNNGLNFFGKLILVNTQPLPTNWEDNMAESDLELSHT
jgi:hypothetical protein